MALTTEEKIPFFRTHGVMLRGWALVEEGQEEEGLVRLRAGIDALASRMLIPVQTDVSVEPRLGVASDVNRAWTRS